MVRSRIRLLLAVAAIAAVVACDPASLTGSGASANGDVSWIVRGQQVEVSNETADTIRYALVGRGYYHTALAQFCFGSSNCGLLLPPRLTGVVSYLDIAGSAKPETEAMLIWWKPAGAATVAVDTAIVTIR
jgi:hypothetical protein